MFKTIAELVSYEDIRELLPVPDGVSDLKQRFDANVKAALSGGDSKKLLIIGPCSLDSPEEFLEYSHKLKSLADKVSDIFIVIPRIFSCKPRSSGGGYLGFLHQKDAKGIVDIGKNIERLRRLHIENAVQNGFFGADELLYTSLYPYLEDLLSYASVGSRSSDNQEHRFVAGGLCIPVGFKNNMTGNLESLARSVAASRRSSDFMYGGRHVRTGGNPLSHAVLRGYIGRDNRHIQNFSENSLESLAGHYKELNLGPLAVIIDANHSNSGKVALNQREVVAKVLKECAKNSGYYGYLKGFMIESYLKSGSSKDKVYGLSVTDDCLGFSETEELVLYAADNLRKLSEQYRA